VIFKKGNKNSSQIFFFPLFLYLTLLLHKPFTPSCNKKKIKNKIDNNFFFTGIVLNSEVGKVEAPQDCKYCRRASGQRDSLA
jgi:hypothetical protein